MPLPPFCDPRNGLEEERARFHRIDFATTVPSPCDDGGCLEIIVNEQTGRCVALCNECGNEVGSGSQRQKPEFVLEVKSAAFLAGLQHQGGVER